MQYSANTDLASLYSIQQESFNEFLLLDFILNGTIPLQTLQLWWNMISQHLNTVNMEQANKGSFIKIKSISKTTNCEQNSATENVDKSQVPSYLDS